MLVIVLWYCSQVLVCECGHIFVNLMNGEQMYLVQYK